MLTPEHKTRWLAALRSGEYPQAKGFLYNKVENGYCCLGVDIKSRGAEFSDTGTYCTLDGRSIASNSDADELLLLYADEVSVGQLTHLMHMNDSGAPFSTIAMWIEQNL